MMKVSSEGHITSGQSVTMENSKQQRMFSFPLESTGILKQGYTDARCSEQLCQASFQTLLKTEPDRPVSILKRAKLTP